MGWRDKVKDLDRNEVFDKLEGLRGALIRMFLIIAVLSGLSFFSGRMLFTFSKNPSASL